VARWKKEGISVFYVSKKGVHEEKAEESYAGQKPKSNRIKKSS